MPTITLYEIWDDVNYVFWEAEVPEWTNRVVHKNLWPREFDEIVYWIEEEAKEKMRNILQIGY